MKNSICSEIMVILMSVFLLSSCENRKPVLIISSNVDSPQIEFAINEIQIALAGKDVKILRSEAENANIIFDIKDNMKDILSEGYKIRKVSGKLYVEAIDQAGALYGGLELAEQIQIYGLEGIKEMSQNPYMEMRGTKFNIPLDVRSPSYTDMSDVAQVNIPEMWSMDFWKEYIDNLARYRYNFISLWNLHPFPSMVKVPGYEDVALDDVHRSTYKDFKEYYSNDAIGLSPPEIVANPEIVKEISIEKKIEFWKEVMAYGKSRNVDFYIMTWNIFLNGVNEEYGMTEDIWNETTKDYFRKSVKEMFLTYPDLSGIGVTVGENMRDAYELKEDWIYDTYAEGVIDAAKEMPERNITFIHRQHMTGAPEIIEKFRPIEKVGNVDFLFSFKYAVAHVMSATKQYRHQQFVEDITAENMKTIWTLRNDDTYYFRWGAPDFVREFIQNIPYEVSRGYYYGSDQWVWGREFTTKDVKGTRELEIVKHWYNWMMWGRLGYNPELDNDRFRDLLEVRFPETDALKLFQAWQEASMIYPVTTGFHWGAADYMWYIEGCKSRPQFTPNETGFHDVNHFIDLPPHKRSGYQSIPDFVKMTMEGGSTDLKNPLQVAELLHGHVNKALSILESLSAGSNVELERTLHDIRTMSSLGKYYAHKIAGSAQLALYRGTKEKEYQEAAIKELKMALEAWKEFTENGMKQNINPIWTNRVGNVDWIKTTEWVKKDIEIASE